MSQSKCLKEKPKEDINKTVNSEEAGRDKLEKKIKKKKKDCNCFLKTC